MSRSVLPRWLVRDQVFGKRRVVDALAAIPPGLDSAAVERAVDSLIETAMDEGLPEGELSALRGRLVELLLADQFLAARNAIDELPDSRMRWPAVAAVVGLTVGAAATPGRWGRMLKLTWLLGAAGELGTRVLARQVVDTESFPSRELRHVRWVEARLAVGDTATALDDYRQLRDALARAETDEGRVSVSYLGLLLANALHMLARSDHPVPLHELIADAEDLAERSGSSESHHTAQALEALAARIESQSPTQAARLRTLRDGVRTNVERAAVRASVGPDVAQRGQDS